MKRCAVGICYPNAPQPTLNKKSSADWLPLMAMMAAAQPENNQTLLRFICDQYPKPQIELAELTGWQVPNLSRTLRIVAGYGLAELIKHIREIKSVTLAASFMVLIR